MINMYIFNSLTQRILLCHHAVKEFIYDRSLQPIDIMNKLIKPILSYQRCTAQWTKIRKT